jgi:hypothetical protein
MNDWDDMSNYVVESDGAPLLLGQIVLEVLDFIVCCGRQWSIPNPAIPDRMML